MLYPFTVKKIISFIPVSAQANNFKKQRMNQKLQFAALIALICIFAACKKKELPNGGITSCDFPAATLTIDSVLMGIPNIFTPNGDGQNDVFMVIFANTGTAVVEGPHLVIQNEAGTTVSEGFEVTSTWDGTVDGTQQTGVFNVTFSVFINGVEQTLESTVYSINYNTVEYEGIDCADCLFANQWNGNTFDPGIDHHEIICD